MTILPVDVSASRAATVRAGTATISDGFWSAWQRVNHEVNIPQGAERLRAAGNVHDLQLAGGTAEGDYVGPLYMDSDLYKWLEAAAWEQGRSATPQLDKLLDEFAGIIAAAQQDDGYLNSFVQTGGAPRYTLKDGHELYCAGHLMQAAVAAHRATGRDELLEVARRFGDHLVATFGTDGLQHIDGHPEVEMALVELYRATGNEAYLDLAAYFVDARGQWRTDPSGDRAAYYTDHVPVRDLTTLEGHSVRALYFMAGAADIALETGDSVLATRLADVWSAVVDSKMYVTGGMGSRWDGEAFGAPFELPPDRAYAETCAAIASVQWSWRMLLLTGESRYADLIERTLYNAVLPGLSFDGGRYFYVNTLHLRGGSVSQDRRDPVNGRQPWYTTACCPPNVMRTLASLSGYLATYDDDGVQIQQYAEGVVTAGEWELAVHTDYPWEGRIEIEVRRAPAAEATLAARIPAWCDGATIDGEPAAAGSYAGPRKAWQPGDRVVVELPLTPRLTEGDERVDSIRGCVAIERGPLVYCIEQADQAGLDIDAFRWSDLSLGEQRRDEIVIVTAGDVTAIPYYTWGNREIGPMRIWIPRA